jgi:signal peptidase I
MSPLIKNGDVIKVFPIQGAPLSLGDVVAFTCPLKGQLLIHRIVTKKKGGFITKGDSSLEPDGIIPKTNIIGRVGEVERQGKKVSFGLGRERLLLAFLSRTGINATVATTVWPAIRPIVRRWVT